MLAESNIVDVLRVKAVFLSLSFQSRCQSCQRILRRLGLLLAHPYGLLHPSVHFRVFHHFVPIVLGSPILLFGFHFLGGFSGSSGGLLAFLFGLLCRLLGSSGLVRPVCVCFPILGYFAFGHAHFPKPLRGVRSSIARSGSTSATVTGSTASTGRTGTRTFTGKQLQNAPLFVECHGMTSKK